MVLPVYRARQEQLVRRKGYRVVTHVPIVQLVTTPTQVQRVAPFVLRASTVARQALVHAVVVLLGRIAPILDLSRASHALKGLTTRVPALFL